MMLSLLWQVLFCNFCYTCRLCQYLNVRNCHGKMFSGKTVYYLLVFGAELVLQHISSVNNLDFAFSVHFVALLYCCILFAYLEDKVRHCRGQRTVEEVGSCFLVMSSSNVFRLTVPRILLSESVRLTKVMITSTYICKLHVSNLMYCMNFLCIITVSALCVFKVKDHSLRSQCHIMNQQRKVYN